MAAVNPYRISSLDLTSSNIYDDMIDCTIKLSLVTKHIRGLEFPLSTNFESAITGKASNGIRWDMFEG